jgi:hypothetical protein
MPNKQKIDLQWFARDKGYVSPLLSNLAVDYGAKAREGLVAPLLFPRITVPKPTGKYATFDKSNIYKVADDTMAGERAQANEIASAGKMVRFQTEQHALKSFIDQGDLEFMDGPFKLWEERKTDMLTGQLELNQEKRTADTVLNLPNRSASLSGTGTAATNKWSNASDSTGGDPFTAIKSGIDQCFYRPNLMVLAQSVFDALEYHPVLLKKLGEANMIKKVDEDTLAKLFRVDKVVIAQGRADFGKKNKDNNLSVAGIWGNSLIMAYVDSIWDNPCCGKTVAVQYKEADNAGYIVRTWDEQDGGLLGGEYIQVGQDTEVLVVCNELIYTLKDVL